ncbi:MAG: hypothetical protein IKG69_11415 [Atopobiaceae bacterium]|nr:hypothetical protein [Atopobiaceae bacterium]
MSVNPDTIPRYAQPLDPPEPRRRCGDCRHYGEVEVVRNPGVGRIGRCLDVEVSGQLAEVVGVCCVERDEGEPSPQLFAAEPGDDPGEVGCDWWAE